MTFDEWSRDVPNIFRGDALWRRQDYQLAGYVAAAAWDDAIRLMAHPATRLIAGQLYRAVGSISANLAEGYSRRTGPDRARFYEYALGSARESREWYQRARPVLGAACVDARLESLTRIIRLQLATLPVLRQSGSLQPLRRSSIPGSSERSR